MRNWMELRDEGEFVTLRAPDQLRVHVANRRIIHLATEPSQRMQKRKTRQLLHDKPVRSYSAVAGVSAIDRSWEAQRTVWRYCFLLRR
jgi:hypothetical protein